MIVSDFLPTSVQDSNIPVALTDTIPNLSITDFPEAYDIGYINDENISTMHGFCELTISNGVYRFTPYDAGNVPVSILGYNNNNFGGTYVMKNYNGVIQDNRNTGVTNTRIRFVNQAVWDMFSVSRNVAIAVLMCLTYTNYNQQTVHTAICPIANIDWFLFRDGTSNIPFTFTVNNQGSYSGTLSYSDLQTGSCPISFTTENPSSGYDAVSVSGYAYVIEAMPKRGTNSFSGSWTLESTLRYPFGGLTQGTTSAAGYTSFPVPTGSGNSYYPKYSARLTLYQGSWIITESADPSRPRPDNMYFYKLNGFCDSNSLTNREAWVEYVNGNTLWIKPGSSTNVIVLPIISLPDAEKIFYWGLKVSDTTDLYGDDVYYPEIVSNQFTGRLINVATPEDAPEKLEEFQQEDKEIQETNDFDPETDIPDTPSGGEIGDDGENPENEELIQPDISNELEDEIDEIPDGEDRSTTASVNFITQYVLTIEQVFRLGETMWTSWLDSSSWTDFKKNFFAGADTGSFNISEMLNFVVSLRYYPFDLNEFVPTGAYPELRMGTGHTAILNESVPILANMACVVDCGSMTCRGDSNFSDFRDYHNCSITAYLPYCGTAELNPSDVFNRRLTCKYYVDLQSGTCTACIFAIREESTLLVASKSGQIGFLIPMTATNAGQVTGTFINDAANMANLVGQAIISAATASATSGIAGDAAQLIKDPAKAAIATRRAELAENTTLAKTSIGAGSSGLNMLGSAISRAGISSPALSGGAGISSALMQQVPYVVIRRLDYSKPANWHHSIGGVCTKSDTIGSFHGFNRFVNVDLKNITANEEEKAKIKSLLESGIYVDNVGSHNPSN